MDLWVKFCDIYEYSIFRIFKFIQNMKNLAYKDTMNSRRRLLILSCSQRKHTSHKPLPAIDRYNGPLFFVLRRFLRECPLQAKLLDVYILSAKYGLIPADFPTALYDQKMTPSRAVELECQVAIVFSDIIRANYTSICFVLGKTYLKAFEGTQDLVPIHTEPIFAYGPIGKKQAQLKKWLWDDRPHTCAERNLDESGSY